MEQTLTRICGELNNWFYASESIKVAEYTIHGGALPSSDFDFKEGQCVLIIGSTFNDGVHMYPCYDLQDETFVGAVRSLNIPPEVMQAAVEIDRAEAEQESSGTAASPYTSESFGGYSYTRATGANGVPLSPFALVVSQKLEKWRKMP